ncbi:NAD-dependent epimerase/dehydratase family protein [Rhizobium deserti]|uniref:NAD-dependent epimerase/dehydratase family protein n=1 Tax=Rhizobium deserti TaxID=2547961 RepID=A0A4R5UN37_9HYPH|nr:NAD(P)H-binding protein [Rhizobium deserti]TDK39209.1 NAD-dependent epimerase/dehydratase family protein [Rhizobium deserti]
MSAERYLVTGATGETGRYTVKELLQRGHEVRALVRKDDERAEELRSSGAEVVVGDMLEHDDLLAVTKGVAGAYFCYPVRPGIVQATAYLADALRRGGARVLVNMSQISAREDSRSHAARDHWIAERIFDWSRVPVVHLRPTFFSQWFLYPHAQASIVNEGAIDLPYGEGRHAPIAAEDQARFIAAVLESPAEHIGRTYALHGPVELDQKGIAAAIGEVLGIDVQYRPTTVAQYKHRLEAQGLPPFLVQHFCAIAVDYQNGLFSGSDKVIEQVTGTRPLTVREFVELHRNEFAVRAST